MSNSVKTALKLIAAIEVIQDVSDELGIGYEELIDDAQQMSAGNLTPEEFVAKHKSDRDESTSSL